KHIDIRVVSATNADLAEKVRGAEFREDLYYRIKGVNIETRPLSERQEDVPVLLQAFLSRLQQQQGKSWQLSPEAMHWFRSQTWPGNVRELRNALESVASICPEGQITLEDIQLLYPATAGAVAGNPASAIECTV
ncbi:sigma 54-interacting transcriptional regulator, partial [Wenyingzhuangia sp. 1_MG-2023]|nr:sigma 54-interacting transcriptional regulator [Wenyingzhuangia sp. 1_MG-2023]